MKYDITIYEPQKTNPNFRFILGTDGVKPLLIIGLNPSTADDMKPDMTISKVMGFATRHSCDSFIMFNLYAQRTPDPDKLHLILDEQLHKENISHILTMIEKYKDISILAGWGGTFTVRDYFKKCLADIYNKTKFKEVKWLTIGLTQSGHPRHPSRAAYTDLSNFDIEAYLNNIIP